MGKSFARWFKKIDMFGYQVPIFYDGDSRKKFSSCGACMTLLIWMIVLVNIGLLLINT